MLLIISDLHLSDGSTGNSITTGAFGEFEATLKDLATSASWRSDDKYLPVTKIDVLMLGDIFDMIRSTVWHGVYRDRDGNVEVGLNPGNFRPWEDPRDFCSIVDSVTDRILRNNAPALRVLKRLSQDGILITTNPLSATAPAVTVLVNFHYVVGNNDWMLAINDPMFDKVRAKIIGAVGLSNITHAANRPFRHDTDPSGFELELKAILKSHKVFARHGDKWDETNFEHDKNVRQISSLGDAFVIDMLCKFQVEIANDAEIKKSPQFMDIISGVREMDNVRPATKTPAWLSSFLQDYPAERESVLSVWKKVSNEFLGLKFVLSHNNHLRLKDAYDKLYYSLKISQLPLSITCMKYSEEIAGSLDNDDVFLAGAIQDAKENPDAHFIVYGHTHRPVVTPLFAKSNRQPEQIYINSGTWRPVHDQAVGNPRDFEFVYWKIMTYVIFYLSDGESERGGRAFATWNGTLEQDD